MKFVAYLNFASYITYVYNIFIHIVLYIYVIRVYDIHVLKQIDTDSTYLRCLCFLVVVNLKYLSNNLIFSW